MNGIQVEGRSTIRSFATAVSSSLSVIEAAKKLKVDALITHHGLFLNSSSVSITGVMKKKVATLLHSDISLLTYHLPLDAHEELGNNWAVAHRLGWHHKEPFGKVGALFIGVKANFPPMRKQKFIDLLTAFYGSQSRSVLAGKEQISSCGIISGGAHKWLKEAIDLGLDAFVTGTADEPTWHEANEAGIHFFSFGHAATEKIGVQLLGEHLHARFGVVHHFINEDNPF